MARQTPVFSKAVHVVACTPEISTPATAECPAASTQRTGAVLIDGQLEVWGLFVPVEMRINHLVVTAATSRTLVGDVAHSRCPGRHGTEPGS